MFGKSEAQAMCRACSTARGTSPAKLYDRTVDTRHGRCKRLSQATQLASSGHRTTT